MSENINDDMSSKPHYDKPQVNENIIQTYNDDNIASGMYQPSPWFPTPQYSQTAPPQSSYPVPTQTQQAVFPPGYPSVIYDVPQNQSIKQTATKVLAVLQIVIGLSSIVLGLSFLLIGVVNVNAFNYNGRFGIAGIPPGIFVIANGIIGIFSSRNPINRCLNVTNMAFYVVSCFIAAGNIFCFSILLTLMRECSEFYGFDGWRWCSEKSTGIALSVLLLLVYVVEFFVALIGSIYTCLFFECCKQCCRGTSQEVISYPQHAYPHGFGTALSMLPMQQQHQQPQQQQQQQQQFGYNQNNDHPAANTYVNQGYNTETMSANDTLPSYDDHTKLI